MDGVDLGAERRELDGVEASDSVEAPSVDGVEAPERREVHGHTCLGGEDPRQPLLGQSILCLMIRRFIACRVMPSSFAAEMMFPVASRALLQSSVSAASRLYDSRTMPGVESGRSRGGVVDMGC